jgi:hypothetical protein
MRTWTLRIIGALNILFTVLALLYLAGMLQMHWNRWPSSATSSDWVIFVFLLAISVYIVVHLAYCGIDLIKLDESALLPCLLLFASETLGVWLSVWVLWLMLPPSMGKIIFGLWEVAISPVHVEVLSGYSTVGFVVSLTLLLTRRGAPKGVSEGKALKETAASG